MAMINTYTTLDDVRRILRAKPPAGRIRFSESYSVLRNSSDNTGTIELTAIGIHDAFADVAYYTINFGADSSSFTMYKIDREKDTNLIVGTGNKNSDFTTSDGYFSILSTDWRGYVIPGDKIDFQTDSHLSKYDATAFIQDAELYVDAFLESNIRFTSISESSLIFPFDSTSVVPKSVRLATAYMSAYMMYKTIYLDNMTDDTKESYSASYLKESINLLKAFIEKWNKSYNTSGPIIGNIGDNNNLDLNDQNNYSSETFNLYMPMTVSFFTRNEYNISSRAYNFATSSDFEKTIASDISEIFS